MEVRTIVREDGTTGTAVFAEPGEHVMMTGPSISGIKTLPDGTSIDLTPDFIVVDGPEQAAEVNDVIVAHYLENGHPKDVDVLIDPDSGKEVPVQRPFVTEKPDGEILVGVGVAHGAHELDECNGITPADADPRITGATTTFEKLEG